MKFKIRKQKEHDATIFDRISFGVADSNADFNNRSRRFFTKANAVPPVI
jgi:hypothetical protein